MVYIGDMTSETLIHILNSLGKAILVSMGAFIFLLISSNWKGTDKANTTLAKLIILISLIIGAGVFFVSL